MTKLERDWAFAKWLRKTTGMTVRELAELEKRMGLTRKAWEAGVRLGRKLP